MMMTNWALWGLGQEKGKDKWRLIFFSFQKANEQTTGKVHVNEETETNAFISGRQFINKEVVEDKAKHQGVEVLAAKSRSRFAKVDIWKRWPKLVT